MNKKDDLRIRRRQLAIIEDSDLEMKVSFFWPLLSGPSVSDFGPAPR